MGNKPQVSYNLFIGSYVLYINLVAVVLFRNQQQPPLQLMVKEILQVSWKICRLSKWND